MQVRWHKMVTGIKFKNKIHHIIDTNKKQPTKINYMDFFIDHLNIQWAMTICTICDNVLSNTM